MKRPMPLLVGYLSSPCLLYETASLQNSCAVYYSTVVVQTLSNLWMNESSFAMDNNARKKINE